MLDKPEIVHVEARHTAVIHLTVTWEDIQKVMDPAMHEVTAALKSQGIKPTGPYFSYHFRRPTDTFDFEVGMPVTKPITPVGRVKAGQIPAGRVARTIYRGGYEGLGAAWGEFMAWIKKNEFVEGDALWECYTSGPESSKDPNDWRTELNRPLIG